MLHSPFNTLNVSNHNTVVLPFCRSVQKIEFMLGTWDKTGESLGVDFFFWNLGILAVALVAFVLRDNSHDERVSFALFA